MPILPTPDYIAPFPFRDGNLATLYPPLFRPTPEHSPARERLELPDGDFLSIDRHCSRIGPTRKLAILSHGLEGNARKKYILGMARMVTGLGFDAACWEQRGCGPELNRLPGFYHSGRTDDLHAVVTHCLAAGEYDEVTLIGFSLGGNQILKYLGENTERIPAAVGSAVTFSVPCDLSASEKTISHPTRRIYMEYFMIGLRQKVHTKAAMYPGLIDPARLKGIRSLRQFDDRYTAPLNGFSSAEDYYARSSSLQFLTDITIPTLLVNAQNDPFLPPSCYPKAEAATNPNLLLEMPLHGGHVGFILNGPNNVYWSEERVRLFLTEIAG